MRIGSIADTALSTIVSSSLIITEVCGEIRRQPVLGRQRGVVLMKDLLVATFGFKLLLRDTGKLQRRIGGAGGNRLIPELLLLLNILRTGVFGREMEVLCSASTVEVLLVVVVVAELPLLTLAVVAFDEDADEFNSSWELSLEEEQLEQNKWLVSF